MIFVQKSSNAFEDHFWKKKHYDKTISPLILKLKLTSEDFMVLIWTAGGDQCRTCNMGDESGDRFAFQWESGEMLSQVITFSLPVPSIPLSSLSIMAYFPSLSYPPVPYTMRRAKWNAQCNAGEGKGVLQRVWISGSISHNAGIIFPSMRPQYHPSCSPIISSCNLSS